MTPAAHVGPQTYKSKTLATWIALLGGSVGLHRFYLHGFRDRWGWLFIWPSAVGLYGVQRMRQLGADDHLAWALIPFLGLMLSVAMITAIVYGLTPDEKWNARFNPTGPQHHTGWAVVIGVVAALICGAGILMATIAFSAQRYFEYEAQRLPLRERVRAPIPPGISAGLGAARRSATSNSMVVVLAPDAMTLMEPLSICLGGSVLVSRTGSRPAS